MFRKILVPVDGSDSAHKGAEVAADLAGKYGAHVTVMHVLRPGRGIGPELLDAFIAAKNAGMPEIDFLNEHAREIVDREAKAVRAAGIRSVEPVVENGDPAHRIVDYAKAHGVDLIVIGCHGHGKLEGILMGSVSNKVAQLAPCTCVMVR
jgi:nucleotide-binding universal stress UspA family protein